jgi:uncharacterized protein
MPFLIDGHNLINFLPDIELDDPHDEAKLVFKLRGFCAQKKRRRCVVVFDQGLPGGKSSLSTPSVEVIFASYQQTNADRVIRERIHDTQDVQGWTVVSSDNEVLEAAERNGMRPMKCGKFIALLFPPRAAKPHAGINPNVTVPKSQVDEWMNEFAVDETEVNETEPLAKSISKKPQAKSKPDSPKIKSENTTTETQQDSDDVEHWLKIFGEAPAPQATDKAMKFMPIHKKKADSDSEDEPQIKGDDIDLSENTVDAWMDVFGDADPQREATDPAFQRNDPSKQGRYRNENGKREPLVHKRMGTAPDIHLNDGEVDAWMDVFGTEDEEE